MSATATGVQWQELFENWPDAIPREGFLITNQAETVPFVDFLIAPGLLLVERGGPDAAGTRKAIIAYDSISMIKLSSAGEIGRFQTMGFRACM